MQTKDAPARVKAAGEGDGLGAGEFTALVSVFGNEDSVGDVVMPGAFADDLARWKESGDPIPVIWSHDWGDPFSHIGSVTEAKETPAGLLVTGQLDLENPKAEQVFRLLKGRRVTQFSFAYDILDGGWGERDGGEVYELRKLKVHEVGPCLVGANQETELLAAKAASVASGAKAGRVLSQKNFEALTAAYTAIGEVLDSATPEKAQAAPSKEGDPGQPGASAADGEQPSAQPEEALPAKAEAATETMDSSIEEETTPDLREATPEEGAAKAAAASARLRTEFQLKELELSLTE
ncbi:HK97 family phage prohead protease [Streptomyces sp. NPDC091299]|uniref:HK97 family phage prohead protease n=1 Tax=Streptomyces sp. NPDC091299 TaxID=3155302 RepID=UPI003449278E